MERDFNVAALGATFITVVNALLDGRYLYAAVGVVGVVVLALWTRFMRPRKARTEEARKC